MKREEDVTGAALRELRQSQGKFLKDFWGEVYVGKSAGSYYETGGREIPPHTRRLCYLHFVCGLNIHMKNPKKAAKLLEQHGLNN